MTKAHNFNLTPSGSEKSSSTFSVVEGGFFGAWIPYVRQTRKTRFASGARGARARAYDVSRAAVGFALREAFARAGVPTTAPQAGAFRVSLAVALEPTKKRGDLTRNGNDFDNYLKALVDAAIGAGLFKDDAAAFYRGDAGPIGGRVASGIYLAPRRAAYFRFEAVGEEAFEAPFEITRDLAHFLR